MECSPDLELDDTTAPPLAGVDPVGLLQPIGTTVWSTASGRRVSHVVYSLVGCPPVEAATYLLVRQSRDGTRQVLAVRTTRSPFPSVNLARIRRAGARRGATEVHLFRGAASDEARRDLVSDLCRAHHIRSPYRRPKKSAARGADHQTPATRLSR